MPLTRQGLDQAAGEATSATRRQPLHDPSRGASSQRSHSASSSTQRTPIVRHSTSATRRMVLQANGWTATESGGAVVYGQRSPSPVESRGGLTAASTFSVGGSLRLSQDQRHYNHPERASRLNALTGDELASMDVIEYGSGSSTGSIRLASLVNPAAPAASCTRDGEAAPSPTPPSAAVVPLPCAHATTHRRWHYISPYTLRDPVSVRLDLGYLTIAHARQAEGVSAPSPTHPIVVFPYSEVGNIVITRGSTLEIRRSDGVLVSLTVLNAARLMSLYKTITYRVRGVFPANADDASWYFQKSEEESAVGEGGTGDIAARSGDANAAAADAAAPPAEGGRPPFASASRSSSAGKKPVTPRHTASSASPGAVPGRAQAAPCVSSLTDLTRTNRSRSPLADVAPALPPPRVIPSRTAKVLLSTVTADRQPPVDPLAATAAGSPPSHSATASTRNEPGGAELHRVQHVLGGSSPPLAAREERRQLLREHLLQLRSKKTIAATR